MADITSIPIVDVTSENVEELMPTIAGSIRQAKFLALDLEFSGLGNTKLSEDLNQRYEVYRSVAENYTVFSIGLSVFITNCHTLSTPYCASSYTVSNYNIYCMSNASFRVDPASISVLVHHGFDFNVLFSKGIRYIPAHLNIPEHPSANVMKRLIAEILFSGAPLVFHNGLYDIFFLHSHFVAPLSANISSFLCDINEVFSSGVFDTKYITKYYSKMKATYLPYICRYVQREEGLRDKTRRIWIAFDTTPETPSQIIRYSLPDYDISDVYVHKNRLKRQMCKMHATNGYCKYEDCDKIHSIDCALDIDEIEASKKKRRSCLNEPSFECLVSGAEETDTFEQLLEKYKCMEESNALHNAAFDAFMTGYVFAYLQFENKQNSRPLRFWKDALNKIFLARKNMPLIVQSSLYHKKSQAFLHCYTLLKEWFFDQRIDLT